jgi:hypothetical protein
MLRANRSNFVTVNTLPGQTAARAWSSPLRLRRVVPEKPRSM